MDGKLVFCKDGILRMRSNSDDKLSVPLILIQDALKKNQYTFFLNNIEKRVIIEEGTTFGSFLLSLEPWQEVIKDLLDMDIPAYIEEMKKLSVAKNAFDSIVIQEIYSIRRDLDFGERPDDMDIMEWFNRPDKTIKILDTFKIESHYDICGYDTNKESNYSITYTPLAELKNVPLIFNKICYLTTSGLSKLNPSYLLNRKSSGVYKEKSIYYIEGESNISLHQILKSVINAGLFFYSPQGGEDAKETITETLDELNLQFTEAERISESNNDTTEIKRIEIAEGAFSDVIKHCENELDEWDFIKKNINKNSKLPIRIGDIKEAVTKEKRLYGMILKSH